MGKSIIYTWPFSIAMLNYQRVFRRSPSPPNQHHHASWRSSWWGTNGASAWRRPTIVWYLAYQWIHKTGHISQYFVLNSSIVLGPAIFWAIAIWHFSCQIPPESDTLHLKLLPCWVHNFLLSELPEAFIWGWINIINSPKLDVLQKQLSLWLNSKINTGTHWGADQLR